MTHSRIWDSTPFYQSKQVHFKVSILFHISLFLRSIASFFTFLDLSVNSIESLPSHCFSDLNHLNSLFFPCQFSPFLTSNNLDLNSLSFLPSGVFDNLHYLNYFSKLLSLFSFSYSLTGFGFQWPFFPSIWDIQQPHKFEDSCCFPFFVSFFILLFCF